MKYKVKIVETYRRTIEIEAMNEDAALDEVDEMIESGEVDLPCDGGDYDYDRELFVSEEEEVGIAETKKWILTCSKDGINVDYEAIIDSEEEPSFWECNELAERNGCNFWSINRTE